MTTPTKITSMITTATTMMTDVVVVPSLVGLLVGCKLLTGTIPVVAVCLSFGAYLVGCMLLRTGTIPVVVVGPMVWERMVSSGNDAEDRNQNVEVISTFVSIHQADVTILIS